MVCCFDLGIAKHGYGLPMMTAGQPADFKEDYRKNKYVPDLPDQAVDGPGRQALQDGQPMAEVIQAGEEDDEAASSTGHEGNVASDDLLTECCIDPGIPKCTFALMTDGRRAETKELIVECTKELIFKCVGMGHISSSIGQHKKDY